MIGRSIAAELGRLHKNTAEFDEKCHSLLGFGDGSGGSAREMKRFGSYTYGLLSALVIAGCPASLSNPDDFIDGGSIEKDAETILAESCGTTGCHDASPQAQAGLDLISPNVESRVVDVNAIGLGCESAILVVAGDPDGSYLLDKVLNLPTICGLQMPLVGSLTPDEIQILRQWIIDLGGSGGGAPDGG